MRALLKLAADTALAPPAFLWAPAVPASVLALFVLAWGDGTGVTAWPDSTFYEQARFIQIALLLGVLPWTAQRALPEMSEADWTRLSAFTGSRPSALQLSRVLVALIASTTVVLASLPIVILAQRMSGGSLTSVALDGAALLGLATLSSVAAAWIDRWTASPTAAWSASVFVTMVVAAGLHTLVSSAPTLALAFVGCATVALVILLRITDRDARLAHGGTS